MDLILYTIFLPNFVLFFSVPMFINLILVIGLKGPASKTPLTLTSVFISFPFFFMIGFMVIQFLVLFTTLISFIYFFVVWFRRMRLLNRFLNKAYDLFSSDLGIKEYVKRDYSSFLCSMFCIKQKVTCLGSLNGIRRFFIHKPEDRSELYRVYGRWETAFNKNLEASEEFKGLEIEDKIRVLEETKYVFRGLLAHAQIGFMAGNEKAASIFVFPLTTIRKDQAHFSEQQKELLLIIEGRLTKISPDLISLFERWSVSSTGRGQGIVTGYSIFYSKDETGIIFSEERPDKFNEHFLEKENIDRINRSLEIYENPLKEIPKLNGDRERMEQVMSEFSSANQGRHILDVRSKASDTLKEIMEGL